MSDTRRIRVLLIEDEENDAKLIRGMLSKAEGPRFELDCVDRLSAAVDRLGSGVYDMILSDLALPDSAGIDTFEKVQETAGVTPVIVLSGYQSEEMAVKAVKEGAQDYLVKGSFDGNLLVRSILYSIEREKMLIQLQESSKEIKTLKGLIPICAWCGKLRDDDGYWKQLETYMAKHTEASFTHGICPECAKIEFSRIRPAGPGEPDRRQGRPNRRQGRTDRRQEKTAA
jgi:CheY-like chemotaxis protein